MPAKKTSASNLRRLQARGARLLQLQPARRVDISATEIRQRVAAGRAIDHLVPPAVARVIAQEKIYRAKTRRK